MHAAGRAAEGPARPDTEALMAEIEREARERRRSGAVPERLEEELDAAFAAAAPPGATGTGLDAVLDRTERAALVDPVGPTASRFPGVSFVRRILRRLLAFYVEHVARQVTAFGVMVVRALRLLAHRVDALEAASPASDPRVRAAAAPVGADLDPSPWFATVAAHLAAAPGRVLHAECGDGALLVHLANAGIDAYGVDPRDDAAALADARALEVRTVGALAHLRCVGDGALGGIVLANCVDRAPLGELLELLDRARAALPPGAPLVVLGVHPGAWARTRSSVAVDLAPGRPLHPATWEHLLARGGFADVAVHLAAVTDLAPTGDAAADENFRRLGAAVLAPESFAVTARRAPAP